MTLTPLRVIIIGRCFFMMILSIGILESCKRASQGESRFPRSNPDRSFSLHGAENTRLDPISWHSLWHKIFRYPEQKWFPTLTALFP